MTLLYMRAARCLQYGTPSTHFLSFSFPDLCPREFFSRTATHANLCNLHSHMTPPPHTHTWTVHTLVQTPTSWSTPRGCRWECARTAPLWGMWPCRPGRGAARHASLPYTGEWAARGLRTGREGRIIGRARAGHALLMAPFVPVYHELWCASLQHTVCNTSPCVIQCVVHCQWGPVAWIPSVCAGTTHTHTLCAAVATGLPWSRPRSVPTCTPGSTWCLATSSAAQQRWRQTMCSTTSPTRVQWTSARWGGRGVQSGGGVEWVQQEEGKNGAPDRGGGVGKEMERLSHRAITHGRRAMWDSPNSSCHAQTPCCQWCATPQQSAGTRCVCK